MKQTINMHRSYGYDPWDVAVAFYRVAKKRYGEDCFRGVMIQKFFIFPKKLPLNYVPIPIGPGTTEYGIMGPAHITKLGVDFEVNKSNILIHEAPSEKQEGAEEFLKAVGEHLDTESIYKGKAIDITTRRFLNSNFPSSQSAVYNEKVARDLETHVWTVFRNPKACLDAGIAFQRKVLFTGPFGAGKSLTITQAAKIATENGLTFLYLPPTDEQNIKAVEFAYEFARRYQPAVVAFEDIDEEQRVGYNFIFRQIQNSIDGVGSKGSNIFTIMTTNRHDNIDPALMRPGRIDKIIDFGQFESEDIIRLLRSVIPDHFLGSDIDWDEVVKHCKGFAPVFVCEIGTRAKLSAIRKSTNEQVGKITTEVLVSAAEDLSEQHKSCTRALGTFGEN